MVVACHERVRTLGVPIVDMSQKRGCAAQLMVAACEEFGFFKVVNHGVPAEVVERMEAEATTFFSLPASEKQKAGPPSPLGYGSRNIGLSGDTGEVEYLILHANPATVCKMDPSRFSCAVGEYVGAARELACTILEMLGEALHLRDASAITGLIRDTESDSLLRLNLYPSCGGGESKDREEEKRNSDAFNSSAFHGCCRRKGGTVGVGGVGGATRVGFGEHTDPQVITLLRSNDAPGLQILRPPNGGGGGGGGGDGSGVWVPVPPDAAAFFVNVGDVLQALTNGRFMSVRHRAVVGSSKPRLSVVYFAAPPLHARISPLPEMVMAPQLRPCLYRSFTWGEYKKAMYSLKLGHDRLELFRKPPAEEQGDDQQRHPTK